jgi:AsmA protein
MNKKMMKTTGALSAAIFLLMAALPYLINVDSFRPKLESLLESSLGREVHIGYLQLSVLAGGARADDISVAEDPVVGHGNFLQAKSLEVGVSLASLIFSRSLHVTSFTLNEPHLTLAKSPSGQWNFSSIGGTTSSGVAGESAQDGSLSSFLLDRLKINNATVTLPDGRGGSRTVQQIDIDLRSASFERAMSFVVSAHTSAGKVELRGEAGPVNRTDPEQTPFHVNIEGRRADLGQIAGVTSGASLNGILKLDAVVNSDGRTLHSEGSARAEKLRLVGKGKPASQPVELHYATDYSFAQQTGTVDSCEISSGKATAHVTGSYGMRGKNMTAHLRLRGSQMPLENLKTVLPALGIDPPTGSTLKGGVVSANIVMEGPMDRMVTSGGVDISNARLAGFNLGSKLASIPGLSALKSGSDLSLVSLSTGFRVSPSGTHISNLKTQILGIGGVTGEGNIDGQNRLQFHMVAHVASDGVLRGGLDHVGLRGVPDDIGFQVLGTTSVPIFVPDVSAFAKNAAKNAAKEAVKNAAKRSIKEKVKETVSVKPENPAPHQKPAASMVTKNDGRGGLFHRLFGHRDKQKGSQGVQLASKR